MKYFFVGEAPFSKRVASPTPPPPKIFTLVRYRNSPDLRLGEGQSRALGAWPVSIIVCSGSFSGDFLAVLQTQFGKVQAQFKRNRAATRR